MAAQMETLGDVVMAIETMSGSVGDISAKLSSDNQQLDDIKQALFRIEELLGQVLEELARGK